MSVKVFKICHVSSFHGRVPPALAGSKAVELLMHRETVEALLLTVAVGRREYVVCKIQSFTPANTNNCIFCTSFIQHEFYNHVLPPTWNSKPHKFVESTIFEGFT